MTVTDGDGQRLDRAKSVRACGTAGAGSARRSGLAGLGDGGGRAPIAPERFVARSAGPVVAPLVRLRLHLTDRALVTEGERVEAGQPIVERARESAMVEMVDGPAYTALGPGDPVAASTIDEAVASGVKGLRPGDRASLLYHGPDARVRVALGRHLAVLVAPMDAVVEHIGPGRLDLRADGLGLPAVVGWGQPAHGLLRLGVSSPDAELRASAVDVGAAGSIVVAGARVDIEALTRARAIGVAGIVAGGVVGRELRQLEESDVRQRAALHAAAPFALLALDGYGRRPIPGSTWDLLQGAEGRHVGILPEAGWLIVGGDPTAMALAAAREPSEVRITAGEALGREGRLIGLAGPIRGSGGLYQTAGFVEDPTATDMRDRRRVVPLADLERFG